MELLQLRYFYGSAHTDTREVRRQITGLITETRISKSTTPFMPTTPPRNTTETQKALLIS